MVSPGTRSRAVRQGSPSRKETLIVAKQMTPEKLTVKQVALPSTPNLTPAEVNLLHAATTGDMEGLYQSLWTNANINCKKPVYGTTPLALAARAGNQKIAAVLLNFGASMRESDEYGVTPLHWASGHGFDHIVQLLLNKGISHDDLCRKDFYGSTPLHFASVNNQGSTLRHGSDPTITNNNGRKPHEVTSDESIRTTLQEEDTRSVQRRALRTEPGSKAVTKSPSRMKSRGPSKSAATGLSKLNSPSRPVSTFPKSKSKPIKSASHVTSNGSLTGKGIAASVKDAGVSGNWKGASIAKDNAKATTAAFP